MDGYAIASASMEYRSAAYLALGELHLKQRSFSIAFSYAKKSLEYNAVNLPAHELVLLSLRKMGKDQEAKDKAKEILHLDPLNHFTRIEKSFLNEPCRSQVKSELSHETYLEIALKYVRLDLNQEAIFTLNQSPNHPIVTYWLAYLQPDLAKQLVGEADAQDPYLVFPFRKETLKVLKWAANHSDSWKLDYYGALIWWNLGRLDKARELFKGLKDRPDFYPFYLAKAKLFKEDLQSLIKASNLAPDLWRPGLKLSAFYLEQGKRDKAIEVIKPLFKKDPSNYYLGLHYAKALLCTGKNPECLKVLENLRVLPNEGATAGRMLFREVNLNLAVQASMDKDYEQARGFIAKARTWPENLGVGRPYVVDERIEDYLMARSYVMDKENLNKYITRVLDYKGAARFSPGDLTALAALKDIGAQKKALDLIKQWNPDDPIIQWAESWLKDQRVKPQERLSAAPLMSWVQNFLLMAR